MKNKHCLLFLILISIGVGMMSCKSSKKLSEGPTSVESPDVLFTHLKQKEFKFDSFEARLNISYKENRKYLDFKGQVRIVKDSVIWISFNQDLGIEIARLLITQDSVKFLDRLHKTYLITDYDFINNFLKTNIDFGILQSILLGNDFEYYENATFKSAVDGQYYKLSTGERRKLKKNVRSTSDADRVFLQSIWLNPNTFKIERLKMKELTKDSKKLSAEYSDFENFNGQLFSTTVNYLVEAADAISVEVDYNRIILNEKMNFPFKIPSKYTPAN